MSIQIILGVHVFFSAVCYGLAKKKGKKPLLWTLAGLIFGFLTMIVLFFSQSAKPELVAINDKYVKHSTKRKIGFLFSLSCFFAPIIFTFITFSPFYIFFGFNSLSNANAGGLVFLLLFLCGFYALFSIIQLANYCIGTFEIENKSKYYFGLVCGLLATFYSINTSKNILTEPYVGILLLEVLPVIGCIFLISCTEIKQNKKCLL